jgi:hypothetical protein
MFPFGPLPDTAEACVVELEELERLKSAACARQARLAARLDEPDLRAAGSGRVTEKAMASEVGLARRESPARGGRLLRLARALVEDHPGVLGMLEAGELNERRAEIIVTETAHLPLAERRAADAAVVDKLTRVPCLGDRDLAEETRRIVLRLDPDAAERRRAQARRERHVRARTRADGVAEVTGVVEDWQMAAIMGSLRARADLMIAQGDERTRAQLLADLFVERLAGLPGASGIPVMLDLIMPVETLFADEDTDGPVEPAEVPGLGPIPARLARDLIAASPEARTGLRRLFSNTDHLVAMESGTRLFSKALREFITLRDRRCRTPWCDAPIRHADHIDDHADGGPTSAHNGQGLCAGCNHAKQHPHLDHTVVSTDLTEAHATHVTTPAGASYDSRAPAPPGDPRDHFVQTQPGVWTRIA